MVMTKTTENNGDVMVKRLLLMMAFDDKLNIAASMSEKYLPAKRVVMETEVL